MSNDRTPETCPVSPEFVLVTFREWHRLSCNWGEADPEFLPEFDSTLAAWGNAFDWLSWSGFTNTLNHYWSIHCTQQEWKAVLEPEQERTIRDLCEMVARHARIFAVPPLEILGASCPAGGAFLAVQALLAKAGANPEEISPSTPLEEYGRRYGLVFLGVIRCRWPGALQDMKPQRASTSGTVVRLSRIAEWVGILLIIEGLILGGQHLWQGQSLTPALILISVGIVPRMLSYILSDWLNPPLQVSFGALRTFKALARRLSAHQID